MPDRSFAGQVALRRSWRRYVDQLDPHRLVLHAYCCRLTGNLWDGEDLVQDTLARVFTLLGKTDVRLENPKAYLIRTATNLWIDHVRQTAREQAVLALADVETASPVDTSDVPRAASRLFQQLHPQERAAVVMKDVLDLSLEETAAILRTTVVVPGTRTITGPEAASRIRRTAARGGGALRGRTQR